MDEPVPLFWSAHVPLKTVRVATEATTGKDIVVAIMYGEMLTFVYVTAQTWPR